MSTSESAHWLPVQVQAMTEADLQGVLSIEQASFPAPWRRETFLGELYENRVARLFVARAAGGSMRGCVVGYTCTWAIADEIHITNFAVHPEFRRQHVGQQLLLGVLAQAQALGCRQAVLEVRSSNRGAQRLYARFGFAPVAVRKRYYTDNNEDAIVMFLDDIAPHLGNSSSQAR